jgi:hypothetical protein
MSLALLLLSEGQQRRYTDALEHPAYEVLERYSSGMTDERKADLYARLAETVDPKSPLIQIQRACSDALYANDKEFPHG